MEAFQPLTHANTTDGEGDHLPLAQGIAFWDDTPDDESSLYYSHVVMPGSGQGTREEMLADKLSKAVVGDRGLVPASLGRFSTTGIQKRFLSTEEGFLDRNEPAAAPHAVSAPLARGAHSAGGPSSAGVETHDGPSADALLLSGGTLSGRG